MIGQTSISRTAAMIADGARAEMLLAMMDGRSFPASDLARFAHVSASTASHHLSLLVDAGLVEVFSSGRHRYHRIANSQVAELLESMGAIEDSRKPVKVLSARAAQLANSRTCYDHIAGRLGVELRKSLERQGVVELHGDRFLVTDSGWDSLAEYGIGKVDRRSLTKVCLDWTERTPHIGSWLGTALYKVFLERRWIAQGDIPRLLVVTPLGKECLMRCFGIAPR